MDFGIDAPIAFDQVLDELEGIRSYPSMVTPSVTVHNGKLRIGVYEFHVRATETSDGGCQSGTCRLLTQSSRLWTRACPL